MEWGGLGVAIDMQLLEWWWIRNVIYTLFLASSYGCFDFAVFMTLSIEWRGMYFT